MIRFEQHLQEELRLKEAQGLLRKMVPVQPVEQGRILVEGNNYLNLAGNDYLGLAGNRKLVSEFYAGLDRADSLELYRPGSGASRLMTGNHAGYRQLEQALAELYTADRALVFNSGYHINIGLLPALSGRDDLILADKLCHASLIDGMRLSRARVIRYPHLDYGRIEDLLKKHHDQYATIFMVTESIFSMNGDCADLQAMVRLKEQYGAVLYVDEAHAVGVRGKNGLGLSEEQGMTDRIDLLVGTFGKAWAGQGAFTVCSATVYDALVNMARSLIFTTGLPPVNIHWLNFVLPKIKTMTAERDHLLCLARRLRSELQKQNLDTDGDSQIVPVMIGNSARSVAAAGQLREHGFWIHAVRPPTVPRGTSRLRLSVTAAMDEQQLAPLPRLITNILQQQ